MVNFIVCDDIKEHSLYIKNLIMKSCKTCNVFEASCKADLYHLIENNDINIIFMDIIFENSTENGIDIVKEMYEKYPRIVIIFMSGYSDYYESVYETEHIYFLKKPFNSYHFNNALKKALKKSEKINNRSFSVKTKKNTMTLSYDDIYYFESSKHNISILLKDSSKTIYATKLSDLEKQLDSDIFARCHQSYIVNLSKILKIEKQIVFLKNGNTIPISKRYLSHVKNLFTLYLGDEI